MLDFLKLIYKLGYLGPDPAYVEYKILFSSIRIQSGDKIIIEIEFGNIKSVNREFLLDKGNIFTLNCRNSLFAKGLVIELVKPISIFKRIIISPKDIDIFEKTLINIVKNNKFKAG